MSLTDYAKSELERIPKDEDGMQDMINNDILEIIETFGEQGHSGTSANYALSALDRLLRWKPLTPLTGEDDEWHMVSQTDTYAAYQNKRCSSVFKDVYKNGSVSCVDNDAIVVSDDGGHTWCYMSDIKKEITFPYTPPIHAEKVYIEYINESNNEYEIITDKPDRIQALFDKNTIDRLGF